MSQIIHISDFHLTLLPIKFSFWKFIGKRGIGYLNWKVNRKDDMQEKIFDILIDDIKSKKPDHISICGDMVNLSLEDEFLKIREKIKNLGCINTISIVFGNHDTYVPGAFKKACCIFSPWISGKKIREKSVFPYMKICKNVAVIGTSSIISGPPFLSAGYFSKKQAKEMKILLEEAKKKDLFRIIMIHHPPLPNIISWHKRLWGLKNFYSSIEESGAELILHGHTHLPTLFFISKNNTKIPVVGVSPTSQKFGRYNPPASYNLFEITKKNNKSWKCRLTRWSFIDKFYNLGIVMKKELYS